MNTLTPVIKMFLSVISLLCSCLAFAQSNTDYKTFTNEKIGINCVQPYKQFEDSEDEYLNKQILETRGQVRFEITQLSDEPFMNSQASSIISKGYFLIKVYDLNSNSTTPLYTLEGAGTKTGSMVEIEGKNAIGKSMKMVLFVDNPKGATGEVNGLSLAFDCDPFYAIDPPAEETADQNFYSESEL